MKIFLVVLVVVILWSVWGYFSSNVEQAQYSVVKKLGGYEVREYAAHIEAQTTVEGSYDEALNKGFTIIAGYIFGGNTKKESIAMTAPVREQKQPSERIAMTAPVVAHTEGDARVIAFVMPKSYSLATLPTPNDSRVRLVEVPAKKMAVLQFSWFRSSERIQKREEQLLSMLSRDKVEVIGGPSYAGYNAPWTPPWMARNEVMVEIR
ncbi:heme-binding protein [Candidatus Parcubacteria bacterium]|nr:heme-binding protein [Candidatus Parcubacteria bacterium]